MAATGYTPISLYYSATATNAPTAGNLVNGELAINITDGKLYYKDNAGVVQLIASKSTTAGIFLGTGAITIPVGTTAQQPTGVQGMLRFNTTTTSFEGYNGSVWAAIGGGSSVVSSFSGGTTGLTPSTATTGAVTLAGTLAIANGGTNSTATPTAGGIGYGTGTAHAYTAAGTTGQVLQSNGASPPSWVAVPSGGFSNMQVFTSPGAFTTPASTTRVKITVVGGGGSGGAGTPNPSPITPSVYYGSGGGGGGAAIYVGAVTASTPYPVTVGSAGGTSSFSTLASATGGSNGNLGTSVGGAGGLGSAGTINIKGSGGGTSSGTTVTNPSVKTHVGGSSLLGGSSLADSSTSYAGSQYGGGGSGSITTGAGGAGAAGVVIVEW